MIDPSDMPTAHQCAVAIITAARMLGDDPLEVMTGAYNCASRYYAFGALKAAFPGASNEALGRCVGARTPYAVYAGLINLRKKPWWRQDALNAATDTLRRTGAPFRIVESRLKGNAILPEATVLKRQQDVLTAMQAMADARGEVHASYESIGKKCGLTGGVVAAAIKNLIAKRDVTVIKPGEPRDPATYRVLRAPPVHIAAKPESAPPSHALVVTVSPKPAYEARVLTNYVRSRAPRKSLTPAPITPVRSRELTPIEARANYEQVCERRLPAERGEPAEISYKGDPPPQLSALFNRPPAPSKPEPYPKPLIVIPDDELTCEYDEPVRGDESPAG